MSRLLWRTTLLWQPPINLASTLPPRVSTALKGQGSIGSPAPWAPKAQCPDWAACRDVESVTEAGSAPGPVPRRRADSAGRASSAPEGPPGPTRRLALKRGLAHVLKDTTAPGAQLCPSLAHLAPSAHAPSSVQRIPAPHARRATTAALLALPALLDSAAQVSSASVGRSSPTAPWETRPVAPAPQDTSAPQALLSPGPAWQAPTTA
nr:uncharacterized protein LOC111768827 [Equus caballus]